MTLIKIEEILSRNSNKFYKQNNELTAKKEVISLGI